VLIAAVVICLLATVTSSAQAAAPQPFTRFCFEGSAAGQCEMPLGVATSPTNGHIYVADQFESAGNTHFGNFRIDEFTAWGEFIRAWGWGVRDGAAELQICTSATGCRAGLEGSGPGQFELPAGLAVDSVGNVYIADQKAHRIQKFDSEGHFLLMFGGGVDQGPNHPGNVCTAQFIAEGDTCGAGAPGPGNGEFAEEWAIGNNLAIGLAGQVYVGDLNRIQVFNNGGVYQSQLAIPQPGAVGELAFDESSGDLYMGYPNGGAFFEATLPNVYKLDAGTGSVINTIEVDKPSALAVDTSGKLFVFDQEFIFGGNPSDPRSHQPRVLVFGSDGSFVEKFGEGATATETLSDQTVGLATGSFCFGAGEPGLYLGVNFTFGTPKDFVQAYGPTPDPAKCEPPQVPPSIDGQFAAAVGTEAASLKAQINPHYFTPPVGTTTYLVQWGTAACIEGEGYEGACANQSPVQSLTTPPGNSDVATAAVVLEGLAPSSTYRYRFVAEGSGEPGVAIVGVGGEPGVEGADAAFTTLPTQTKPEACPNDAFRSGAGARLPDCRAYELVSPLDKEGGDAQPRLNLVPFEARMDEASTTGDAITFSAYRAFANPKSAPFSSQYLTERSPDGWQTEAISPPQEGEAFINPLIAIDNLYRAFTPDLQQSWLYTYTEPVLGTEGVAGEPNIYRRDNTAGSYAACTSAAAQSDLADTHGPQFQGYSQSGDLAVFRDQAKLTSNASTATREGGIPVTQAYACAFQGNTATVRLVSVLPSGEASDLENTIGGPANDNYEKSQGRTESLERAVAADGSKVFWTATPLASKDAASPGALYVRLNPGAEPTASGECDEAEPNKACTRLISAGPARFLTAAKDGSIAYFLDPSGTLSEYEVGTEEARPLVAKVLGYLGASEDASRIYFLSEEEVGGAGEVGEPNLYLYDRNLGEATFIATLSARDASQGNFTPSPGNYEPGYHTARVTPDGAAVAFMSNSAALAQEVAGYDNTDQGSGEPVAEVYRYRLGGALACVSCNRSGSRPSGRQIQGVLNTNSPLYAASMLPTWLNSLYAPRALSDAGNRIFFEAFEALSPQDTDNKADVYQWEAKGTGSCKESDSAYDPQSEGCVDLISSGEGEFDSQFIDASPTGEDVFIRTAQPLVAWDPGQIDIYDARANGGLKAPPSREPECEGEASCRGPAEAGPQTGQPATTGPGSDGNVNKITKPKPHPCRKGTHKVKRHGKVRCAKNKHHHGKGKRAATNRRAGR
jgi:DNA-binding beta-propeller fold protein YncE